MTFFYGLMMNKLLKQAYACLMASIGRNTCPMAASSGSTKALVLLHQAMCRLWYRRTAAAIKMSTKVDSFFVAILFAVALAAAGAMRSK